LDFANPRDEQLQHISHELPGFVGSIIKKALDADVFDIVDNRIILDAVEQPSIYFAQTDEVCRSEPSDLSSKDDRRVIAVVDRTANIASAAKALVEARFAFGGNSPYAPDLILVNEFSKSEFLSIAVQTAVKLMAIREDTGTRHQIQQLFAATQKTDGVRIVTSGSNGMVVDITNG